MCEIEITYDNPTNSKFLVELPLDDEKFGNYVIVGTATMINGQVHFRQYPVTIICKHGLCNMNTTCKISYLVMNKLLLLLL